MSRTRRYWRPEAQVVEFWPLLNACQAELEALPADHRSLGPAGSWALVILGFLAGGIAPPRKPVCSCRSPPPRTRIREPPESRRWVETPRRTEPGSPEDTFPSPAYLTSDRKSTRLNSSHANISYAV